MASLYRRCLGTNLRSRTLEQYETMFPSKWEFSNSSQNVYIHYVYSEGPDVCRNWGTFLQPMPQRLGAGPRPVIPHNEAHEYGS